ncbi:hypothetical protein C491_21786 [Natronococcus amylolyticus DSM 10524]|uniref:DUF8108 domain-containing protein n=1 Tax=Natronococcus amylolyticus DSM 10524 TaxID=1227497 RepID=L9WVP9_9EURY|nr:hypothetical protein [Natronococcus amylolyticus]ELY53564.1 hypothetical protein C491_21786 [Natronococcus amylolyticus DSM 10524]
MSDAPAGVIELADRISALLYGIAGWLTVGFGLLLTGAALTFGYSVAAGTARVDAVAGAAFLALFLCLAGLVTVALGLFVNPRFRRRLDRRHGRSTFGWVRSVDQRVVRPEENCLERCVDCGDRVEKGLVRRYREEYALAGLPVYTRSEGYNHYCLECATTELRGKDVADSASDAVTDRSDRSLERVER